MYLYLKSKTAYVALLGPYVAQLRPHVPTLEAQSCPRAAQRRFPNDFGALGTWKNLKKCHTVDEFRGFRNFAKAHQKEVQKAPKSDPREAQIDPRSGQERPRRPQERPGRPPERPKSRQERPKRTQEPPKLGFRAALTAHLSPKSPPEASRSHFGPSPGRFPTLRRPIFTHLSTFRAAFAKLSFAQSLCKHTVSIARRPCVTSAC